jgi:putative ABC transport system permease protein
MAAGIVTGVFFGMAPALQFSRPNLTSALRDGGRSATSGASKQRLRSALLVGEVALAVVLLVGSGLFLTSFARVMAIDLGINTSRVLTFWVPLPSVQGLFEKPEPERLAFAGRAQQSLSQVLAAVQAVPGVEHAAVFSGALPLSGSTNSTSMTLPSGESADVEVKRVSADYHTALEIPLRAGRLFTEADRDGGEPVVILSEPAARQHFGDQSPLGRVVKLSGRSLTVVGVVGAVRQSGPERATRPEVHVPIGQARMYNAQLVIRTRQEPAALLPEIRRAVSSVLPDGVFPVTRTMDEWLDRLVAERRFNMTLFSLFGVLGLAIALVGIYGVMAYTVQQRTAEFGLRMALGAPRGRILGMVLGRAATFMATGLVIGLGAAVALSRLVGAFLFEVKPGDVVVYASAAAVPIVTGLIAALLPARRASSVDPMVALRDG